jgi:hypothetical protein
MPGIRGTRLLVLVLGVALRGPVPALRAQAVRGVLVDKSNGFPIGGGFVVLLDQSGREVARVLTGDGGLFLLRARVAGTYRLQSKRIGFRVATSPPFALADSQIVGYRLEVEAAPAVLPPVIVEGRPQCGTRGDEGTAVAELWDDAREALAAVKWTAGQRTQRYTVQRYDRELDASAREVQAEHQSTWSGSGETPFRSVPAEELAERGYVVRGDRDTMEYYAPDADVLLGDVFVRTHCFTARDGGVEHPGLVGLAFGPVPSRFLPDVVGVLWLERKSLELRFLDFKYTNLPAELPEGALGGYVGFMPLSSGGWVVKQWWIRMARMGRVVYRDTGRQPESKVLGFRETGGQVLSISSASGTVVYSAEESMLEGNVVDSSRGGLPLPKAVVFLAATGREVTADDRGLFQLTASVEGGYGVSFRHPRLDSLGVTVAPRMVQLVRGARATVTLAVPPESSIVAELCPVAPRPGERVVVGVVRDFLGAVVPNAQVRAAWQLVGGGGGLLVAQKHEAAGTADGTGRFVLCGVPSGRVTMVAAGGEARSRDVVLQFSESGVWIEEKQYRSLPGRIWKQDLQLLR